MADQPIKSVVKALNVLDQFIFEKPHWGPRELAKVLNTSHSTTQRLLSTLAKEGILTFSESKSKYTIGPKLWRFGTGLLRQFDFQKIVRDIIEEYAAALNETFYLFSYQKEQIIFEIEVESSHNLRYHLKIGVPYEIHIGAAGKCIIANLPSPEADRYFRLAKKSPDIDYEVFVQRIAFARENDYSFTIGERVAGVVGFAAPIFSTNEELYGGVLLTIPDVRFKQSDKEYFGQTVKDCAEKISNYVSGYGKTPFFKHI